jgi:hypothetical protein
MEKLTVAPRASAPRKALTCNFCTAPVPAELVLTMPRLAGGARRDSSGCFCSARCLDCVLALEALHPSPLAPWELREARGVLIDRLLELWRNGRGPDPALVLRAAQQVAAQPWKSPAVASESQGRS